MAMQTNWAYVGINYVTLLFALCFHEFAHGWVAKKRGDRTAELLGRLTLNPVAHADLIGTVVLPLMGMIFQPAFFLFGWAKPVPVSERNLKNPRADLFWIAAAGPLSNLILGSLGIFLFVAAGRYSFTDGALLAFLQSFVGINFALAFFNLIPIHPLDGGKILARFLPEKINEKLETHQSLLSMFLLVLFVSGGVGMLIRPPILFSIRTIESLARSLF